MKSRDFKKIILIRLDHIGDVLLTTPAIRAVRHHFPDAHISIMVGSWAAEVVAGNAYIDRIFIYDAPFFNRSGHPIDIARNAKTIAEAAGERFDLAINFRDDYNNTLICSLLEPAYTLSYDAHARFPGFITHRATFNGTLHSVWKNLELVKEIGVPPMGEHLDFIVSEGDDKRVENLLRESGARQGGKVVGIFPGGGWHLNMWPQENFAELIKRLTRNSMITTVLIGGEKEHGVARRIMELTDRRPLNYVGILTLHQLGALCKKMAVLITNDGGPMHLASAMDTPIIALFGPSPVFSFRPIGAHTVIYKNFPCSPCPQFEFGKGPSCSDNKCMKAITVDEVEAAVLKKLDSGNGQK